MPITSRLLLGLYSSFIINQFKQQFLIILRCHSTLCHQHSILKQIPTTFTKMAEHLTNGGSVFQGKIDRHKGIQVRSTEEPCDLESFPGKLQNSLTSWQQLKFNAAWFFISIEHSDWVPVLAKNGFNFHHAKPETLAMVRWLAPEPSRVPAYAHTLIGAGAVVMNDKRELLVVQESYQSKPYYKLPGGYVEPGEYIPEAAMREVMEETNVRTQFKSLVAFRHTHGAPFGCSDMYFIVELAPLSSDITKCDTEIEESLWMPVDEYLNHPQVHENNRLFVRKYLFAREKRLAINGTQTFHPISKAPQMLFALGPVE